MSNMENTTSRPSTTDEINATMLASLQAAMGEIALDLLGELAPMFLEDTPPMLAELRRSIADGDAKNVREVAHTLKGSSASMGLMALSQLCHELETMGRDGVLAIAPAKLQQIGAEYGQVEIVLRKYTQ